MKALATLVVLFLLAVSCRASDVSGDGPHLEVVSITGKLEIDRPSVIVIELCNNATNGAAASDKESAALDLEKAKANASALEAELSSPDDSINVLSGPQEAGTLAPGWKRSIRFTALAKGAQKGVYPLQLSLRFSQLVQVTSTGDDSLPDVVFDYRNTKQELPIQVDVVQGPKPQLEEIKGNAAPGKEAELELILANRGDEPANDLQIETNPFPPFDEAQSLPEMMLIEPDGRSTAKLRVHVDEDAAPKYYPLPCRISYRNGENGERRSEDLAVLILVQKDWLLGGFSGLILSAGGLLLLVGGYLGGKRLLFQKKRRNRSQRL